MAAMASLDSDMGINEGFPVVGRQRGTFKVISSTGPEGFSGSCVNVDNDGIEWTLVRGDQIALRLGKEEKG